MAAHSPGGDGEWHLLVDHLRGTAELASGFGAEFGSAEVCHLVGVLHDIGKADPLWQEYLAAAAAGAAGAKLDHKHAGAMLLTDWGLGTCAFPVAGHHGGMPDFQELRSRLQQPRTPGQQAAIDWALTGLGLSRPESDAVIPVRFQPADKHDRAGRRRLELWLRMVFSTLVDADWLDTEAHFRPGYRPVVQAPALPALAERCEQRRAAAVAAREHDPVAAARAEVFAEVMGHATQPPGWFELTAPTGSGKTISALSFALAHAAANGLRRIVTAVPFISVTEQIAREYRNLLEVDGATPVVVEHHSGLAAAGRPIGLWSRLATENWDAPVIVTTMVQLLESLFDNRPSATRKLHNLIGSLLILDEVQSLPWRLLDPTLEVLRELVRSYGCSVVFCTATQPPFDKVGSVEGIDRRQLCNPSWFGVFDRTDIQADPVPVSWPVFAGRVARAADDHGGQCLVVLNTIRDARDLCGILAGRPGLLHLSTRLCPAHRLRVLDEVRDRLGDERPCVLVSTQLVEAGIDIDFPVAVRACGPMPAIAQVAGRVNRHGLRTRGTLIVLDPAEGHLPPHEYQIGTGIARQLLRDGADPLDPATIDAYYDRLIAATADKLDLLRIQQERELFHFATVSRKYRVIAEETTPVLVGYGDFDPNTLVVPEDPRQRRAVLRRLQPFTVSLRDRELERYEDLVEDRGGGVLVWHGRYDPVFGLSGEQQTEETTW
jgi:CRISPR-associated endonuclease/helicase Cas3